MHEMNLKEMTFEYHPVAGELHFSVGKALVYRRGQSGLMLDNNPFGTPELTPVTQLKMLQDPVRLAYESVVKGGKSQFLAKANYTCDELIFPHIESAHCQGVQLPAGGDDKISMEFEGGALSRMMVAKNGAGSDDGIYIFREENKLYYLQKNPKRRLLVSRLSFEEGFFRMQTDEGDIAWRAHLCPFVSEIVADVLNTI